MFETSSQYIATTTAYDALGRVSQKTNPSRPGDGLNYATSYGYDLLGRATRVTTPDGAVAKTTYSGNTVIVTDQAGHACKMTRDALGRITQVVEDPGGLNYITNYSYDLLGNLTQVNQGNGTEVRTFVYDSLSRLVQATNPESGTVYYSYDSNGNLLNQTDNRGIVTTHGYDALNRMSWKAYSDGTPSVTYQYEPNIPNGKGRLASIFTSSGQSHERREYFHAFRRGRIYCPIQEKP